MNPLLAGLPLADILVKWTALLALGWIAHGWLRQGHARWRLILWRSILVFSLVLPLVSSLSLPVLTIPVCDFVNLTPPEPAMLPLNVAVSPAEMAAPKLSDLATKTGTQLVKAAPARSISQPVSGPQVWLLIWMLGCAGGAARLMWFQIQLTRLRSRAGLPGAALAELTRETQAQLNVQRPFRIRVSGAIQSPFVCGLWRPTIMLPQQLAETLSAPEAAALLRHEVAHLRAHDLFWSAGWRWLQVIGWFHPLVWRIPAAHSLACEQEADRVASGRVEDRAGYAQLLAQLALRVLDLPAVETELTVNGTAQIVRRLQHLKRKSADAWQLRHTLAGAGLAGLLFVLAAGCEFSKPGSHNIPSSTEFKQVLVVVQDADGKPLAGATVKPFAFRVQGVRRVDNYGWMTNRFGPELPVTTDREGKVWLKYPVVAFPDEKLFTGELTFTVSHPDYCPEVCPGFPVDGTGKTFRLTRGISLEISGYYGPDRQRVTDLVPTLGQDGIKPEDWQKTGDGVYAFHQLTAGSHLIQLMGRLASGDLVYSDALAFTAEPGKPCHFDMEMKPGIRIEGRLDNRVPRPVKNGRVLIDVRPPQFPSGLAPERLWSLEKKYGYFHYWRTHRSIAADGTFVFESVPPGEVDVIVHGDGFVSRSIGQRADGPPFALPQPFLLTAPLTTIEVETEPTATLELTAKTRWGKPIAGATVHLNPNVMRMGGIFGRMNQSSEEPLRKILPLPELPYSGKTDQDGRVVIRNLPAVGRGLEIVHPQFVVPLREPGGLPNRRVPATFNPGQTNVLIVTMQPAGKDFIGTAK